MNIKHKFGLFFMLLLFLTTLILDFAIKKIKSSFSALAPVLPLDGGTDRAHPRPLQHPDGLVALASRI
jgi:hypothetical protein